MFVHAICCSVISILLFSLCLVCILIYVSILFIFLYVIYYFHFFYYYWFLFYWVRPNCPKPTLAQSSSRPFQPDLPSPNL